MIDYLNDMFKKSCPILVVSLLCTNGQDILDTQYFSRKGRIRLQRQAFVNLSQVDGDFTKEI